MHLRWSRCRLKVNRPTQRFSFWVLFTVVTMSHYLNMTSRPYTTSHCLNITWQHYMTTSSFSITISQYCCLRRRQCRCSFSRRRQWQHHIVSTHHMTSHDFTCNFSSFAAFFSACSRSRSALWLTNRPDRSRHVDSSFSRSVLQWIWAWTCVLSLFFLMFGSANSGFQFQDH